MSPSNRLRTVSLEARLEQYRRSREPQVLGALFDAAAPDLFRLARSILQDASLAEDALQETLLDAFRHLDRHQRGLPVMPWLVGILQRNARKIARQARRRLDRERYLARRPLPVATDTPDGADLAEAIETLEEPYRGVAVLRWHYGLEPAEIAHVRNQPPGTVRSLLSRARERLRASHPRLPMGALIPGLRGLDAVRKAVLHDVAAGSIAAGTTTILGATIVWKYALGLTLLVVMLGGIGGYGLGLFGGNDGASARRSADPGSAPRGVARRTADPILTGSVSVPSTAVVTADEEAITGKIVGEDGTPAADVAVFAVPESLRKTVLVESDTVGRVVTDGGGRFALVPDEKAAAYAVMARATDGRVALSGGVRLGEDVELVLSAPASLSGHILGPDGAPVANARVRFCALLDALRVEHTVMSAGDGTYVIEGIPLPPSVASRPAPTYRCLEVRCEGFAPLFIDDAPSKYGGAELVTKLPSLRSGNSTSLDLVLSRGASYRGVALREDTTAPIVGGRVVLWSIEGRGELERESGADLQNPFYGRIIAETRTAEDGTFLFDAIPANQFHRLNMGAGGVYGPVFGYVVVLKDGYAASLGEVPVLPAGAQIEATVRLWPAAVLEGRVLHADGTPAHRVNVWAFADGRTNYNWMPPSLRDAPTSLGDTDRDGRFRLAGIPAATGKTSNVKLRARLPWAFRGQSHNVAETAEVEVSMRAGETKTLPDITLIDPKPPHVHLRVVTPDGKPVAGAMIFSATGSQTVHTDAEGRARLLWRMNCAYVVGKRQTVAVKAPGFALTKRDVVPALGREPAVQVRLENSHRLEGHVLDKSGRPVPGTTLTVREDPDTDSGLAERSEPGHAFPISLGFGSTNAEGRFVVEDLPAGPYQVQAHAYSLDESIGASVDGVPTDADNVHISLPADIEPVPTAEVGSGASVEGRIVDGATGRPVALFEVTLGPAPHIEAQRIRPGVFRFEGIRNGTWRLSAQAEGYLPAAIDVEVSEGRLTQALRIPLSRGVVVRGQARRQGGSPANHSIAFVGAGGKRTTAAIGPGGRYEVSGLEAGSYWVHSYSSASWNSKLPSLTKADGRPVVIPSDGKIVELDLTLVPAGALSIMATAPGAEETSAVRLELRDGHDDLVTEVSAFPDGRPEGLGYMVLLPGPYRLKLFLSDGSTLEESVEIEVGKRAEVSDWKTPKR